MQKQKESLSVSMAKLVMAVSLIVGIGAVMGVLGYYLTNHASINPPLIAPAPKTISAIEISADAKSILNAETKGVIFTIDDANKYLKDSGYAYNPDTFHDTNAKYAGDCFIDAALSSNKDRIVFSTGYLAGDLPQVWAGTYKFPVEPDYYGACAAVNCIPPGTDKPDNDCIIRHCQIPAKINFLIAGSGRNFVWSQDDKTIAYEADLGLSGMAETRTIDAGTGEVLERKIETKIDTSDWLTYNALASVEGYYAYYKIKYPRDWFYIENQIILPVKPLHNVFFDQKDQRWRLNYGIEVFSEKDKNLLFTDSDFYFRNVKIGSNDFQELESKKYNIKTFIYKTGYGDNLSDNYYIVFRLQEPSESNLEIMISSLSTLQFLGKNNKDAVIGADEGSWKQVFKSEKYGFQLKAQNSFNIIDKLDDNLSMIFVSGFSNIYLGLSRLSGVSTAEEWLDREMTINEYAAKKSEREYYRIGDSSAIGIMADQTDSSGEPMNRVFYTARGQYLYSISAPLIGTNEFVYARMVANFRFLEPNYKLIGLKSKWGLNNVFEFNTDSGKLERALNEKDFLAKGYEWKNVEWYETKIAGVVPAEIKSFFPALEINPQGSMDASSWLTYRDKNKVFELMYPKEWKLEDYSNSDVLYFNVKKEKENPDLPRVIIRMDRNPVPTETLSIVGDVSIVKFNGIEALVITMYGEKGETDPYSYLRSPNTYFIEFHSGSHDYFIEYHFNGGNYNLQEFNTFLSSMKIG